MWLFLPEGFVSVVQKKGQRDLTVRARDRRHLEALRDRYVKSLGVIRFTPDGDYPYRATVSRNALANAMRRIVRSISYDNFKDRAGSRLGGFQGAKGHSALLKVWSAMTEIEPAGIQRRRGRGLAPTALDLDLDRVSREMALGAARGGRKRGRLTPHRLTISQGSGK